MCEFLDHDTLCRQKKLVRNQFFYGDYDYKPEWAGLERLIDDLLSGETVLQTKDGQPVPVACGVAYRQ